MDRFIACVAVWGFASLAVERRAMSAFVATHDGLSLISGHRHRVLLFSISHMFSFLRVRESSALNHAVARQAGQRADIGGGSAPNGALDGVIVCFHARKTFEAERMSAR